MEPASVRAFGLSTALIGLLFVAVAVALLLLVYSPPCPLPTP